MQFLSISYASNCDLCEFFQKVFSLLSKRKSDLKNEKVLCQTATIFDFLVSALTTLTKAINSLLRCATRLNHIPMN